MPLPPRPLHTLNDVAIRWSALPIDVVDWATDGLLVLSIAIPPVKTISSRIICDLVNVAGTDIRPLFRPDGARLDAVSVRRVREPSESEWQWISEPAGGIAITAPEVLITRAEVQRFELEHDLHRGGTGAVQGARSDRSGGAGPGVPPRHDWDAFFGALARRSTTTGYRRPRLNSSAKCSTGSRRDAKITHLTRARSGGRSRSCGGSSIALDRLNELAGDR